MLEININNAFDFTLDDNKEETPTYDIVFAKENLIQIIKDSCFYTAYIVYADYEKKEFVIDINGHQYKAKAKNDYDILIEDLGLQTGNAIKTKQILAPMPGLILKIEVQIGQHISTGDNLCVFEAMKMENTIKAPRNGVVKSILIEKNVSVEKGTVLIEIE